MAEEEKYNMQLSSCGGWNAKIGPGDLSEILKQLPIKEDDNLLVGYDSSDDASVYRLTDDLALIQTIDFFPSMVSDPYLFGQIAAANSLSDVYAMGGRVISALNIVTFPDQGNYDMLGQILKGGADKVHEADAVLSGGHSIHDDTAKYGLSVTGLVHPDKIIENDKAQVGDSLILTKPLGTGLITTAHKADAISQEAYDQACQWMTTLNKGVGQVMQGYQISSATDVTGFGLLGHLKEMTAGKVTAHLEASQIPAMKEAYQAASLRMVTGGARKNRNFLEEEVQFNLSDRAMEEILYDPQTSGGLLISISPDQVQDLLADLKDQQVFGQVIGKIGEKEDKTIIIN